MILVPSAFSPLKKRVTLWAVIDFVAGSPVTLALKAWTPPGVSAGSYATAPTSGTGLAPAGYQGIASVARDASKTGVFLLVMQDPHGRLVNFKPTWVTAESGGNPVPPKAPFVYVQSDKTNVTGSGSNAKTIQFVTMASVFTYAGADGVDSTNVLTPTDPTATQRLMLEIELDDSSAV